MTTFIVRTPKEYDLPPIVVGVFPSLDLVKAAYPEMEFKESDWRTTKDRWIHPLYRRYYGTYKEFERTGACYTTSSGLSIFNLEAIPEGWME